MPVLVRILRKPVFKFLDMPAPAANKRSVGGWQKKDKVKHKVASKRLGIAKKHKETVKLVSGARTKKAQRKLAHKQKLAEKEKVALAEAVDEVEMQDTKEVKKAVKKQRQQKQQGGGAAEAMQE